MLQDVESQLTGEVQADTNSFSGKIADTFKAISKDTDAKMKVQQSAFGSDLDTSIQGIRQLSQQVSGVRTKVESSAQNVFHSENQIAGMREMLDPFLVPTSRSDRLLAD